MPDEVAPAAAGDDDTDGLVASRKEKGYSFELKVKDEKLVLRKARGSKNSTVPKKCRLFEVSRGQVKNDHRGMFQFKPGHHLRVECDGKIDKLSRCNNQQCCLWVRRQRMPIALCLFFGSTARKARRATGSKGGVQSPRHAVEKAQALLDKGCGQGAGCVCFFMVSLRLLCRLQQRRRTRCAHGRRIAQMSMPRLWMRGGRVTPVNSNISEKIVWL